MRGLGTVQTGDVAHLLTERGEFGARRVMKVSLSRGDRREMKKRVVRGVGAF